MPTGGATRAPYRRILIATDGSPTADRAARKGFDLAASVGAPVTLAFVGHPATGKLVTDDTVAVYGAEAECDVALDRAIRRSRSWPSRTRCTPT